MGVNKIVSAATVFDKRGKVMPKLQLNESNMQIMLTDRENTVFRKELLKNMNECT